MDTDLPKKRTGSSSIVYAENFNRADFANEEEMCDVVESFEQLHRSIPWLAKAGVSSECHRGQLQILQAAIDYIIDLEEQLTDQLTGDFYRAALAAASASRRPFADVNSAAATAAAAAVASTDGAAVPPMQQRQYDQAATLSSHRASLASKVSGDCSLRQSD